MHVDLGLWFASPDCHQQGLQWQIGIGAALHRPANNAPRKQIDNDSKIKEPLVGADVSNICDPELIQGIHIELSVQGIISHNNRLPP